MNFYGRSDKLEKYGKSADLRLIVKYLQVSTSSVHIVLRSLEHTDNILEGNYDLSSALERYVKVIPSIRHVYLDLGSDIIGQLMLRDLVDVIASGWMIEWL